MKVEVYHGSKFNAEEWNETATSKTKTEVEA
jgi:hypothetical protein